jgi:bifunctional non-homologous end joining protein LigD
LYWINPSLRNLFMKMLTPGERWVHEIKFDGYRVQLHIQSDAIKVFTRRGNDWTRRFGKSPTTPI